MGQATAVTFGQMMVYVRQHFPELPLARSGSIVKVLVRKYGDQEAERLLEGARLMGWRNLLSLNSADGLGRRIAIAKFWQSHNSRGKQGRLPESVKTILREMIER